MRRALLTARAPLPLTPLGGATSANTSSLALKAVWGGSAAAEAGVVTSVSARCNTAGWALRFFVIRDVAGTWTIQAATGDITSVSGVNAYSVSLPVAVGDHLGVYQDLGGAEVRFVASGSGTYRRTTSSTSPVAGGTYAVSNTDSSYTYAFVGTGTQ